MIGYYNYTVILTYIGLASAVTGIYFAMDGKHVIVSVIALLISGLCDMFDGKIARTRERTESEKRFGIQIDSLCDLICFGVLPGAIGYAVGMRQFYHIMILIFFTLAAVIRLAYFNVSEELRQTKSSDCRKTYEGLPVTSVALILPLFYSFRKDMGKMFPDLYAALILIIGIAFITRFKVKKPKMRTMLIFIGIGVLEFIWLIYRYKIR
ncbi:CDP-alcohol phosphatidyltransferase family protein [Porcipelethomonas sp.]|uniref:CDP-alcohol phosphatidyltransferase family protein n=1 Tax=Porcipelethomonas sp. TaxID=2981675 RepID=UPI003EF3635B